MSSKTQYYQWYSVALLILFARCAMITTHYETSTMTYEATRIPIVSLAT